MLIIQLGTDENIKENIICDCYAFYSFRIKKNSIFLTFWSLMQKKAVEQKKNSCQFHLIGIKYTMEP